MKYILAIAIIEAAAILLALPFLWTASGRTPTPPKDRRETHGKDTLN